MEADPLEEVKGPSTSVLSLNSLTDASWEVPGSTEAAALLLAHIVERDAAEQPIDIDTHVKSMKRGATLRAHRQNTEYPHSPLTCELVRDENNELVDGQSMAPDDARVSALCMTACAELVQIIDDLGKAVYVTIRGLLNTSTFLEEAK